MSRADAVQRFIQFIMSFYHEGHEDNEGKRQSDMSNKVIACAIVIIKYSNKQMMLIQQYLQVLHALHGESFLSTP